MADMPADAWRCASMHDPSGRRGVWFTSIPGPSITVCAGREGDDATVTLKVGDVLTQEQVTGLLSCLEYGAWMQEDYGPNCQGDGGKLCKR